MKLTINQIAELAQVSKATVSKVLNNHKGIKQETRDRVLKLVKQLDYQPDASARALALQKTGDIGLLIPHEPETSVTSYFWSIILSAVSRYAGENGYNLMVLTTPREGDVGTALHQILRRRSVDGLIIGSDLLDKASLSNLIINKIPFVLLGQKPEFQHYCIDMDSHQGTEIMVTHMLAQGYKKIGAIFGNPQYPYVKHRYQGYIDTLAKAGISWHAEEFSTYKTPETQASAHALLDRHPDMDALYIAAGGEFFLDTITICKKRGLRFPDFGIGVFDDYPFLEYLEPRPTAIRQPLALAGAESVRMLTSLIEGNPPAEQVLVLKNTLTIRESCGELKFPV
jgi:LacI family transcriptional regulator